MRAGAQLARRLVEADVTVGANTEDLNVDPAGVRDFRLVAIALLFQIRCRAVQKTDVFVRDAGWARRDALA